MAPAAVAVLLMQAKVVDGAAGSVPGDGRLPRSWPLFNHTADAWGAAQTALQALWPPDGRGVSWALLFIALLALAGLYEGAVFLTERLWGGGVDEEKLMEQEASVLRQDARLEAEDAEEEAALGRLRRLRMGQRLVQLRRGKLAALRAGQAGGAAGARAIEGARVPAEARLAEERFVLRDFIVAERWRGIGWLLAVTVFVCWVSGVMDRDNALMP